MTAQSLISRYNHWQGKTLTISSLKSYRTEVEKYIDSTGHGTGIPELKEILSRVTKAIKVANGYEFIEKVTVRPVVIKSPAKKKAVLGKVKDLSEKPKPAKTTKAKAPAQKAMKRQPKPTSKEVVDKLATEVNKRSLSGVNYKYKSVSLGEFEEEFYRLNSDSNVMVWGGSGHGKTFKLLKKADFYAKQGEKVLFVSEEEYGRSSLDEKLNKLKIDHPNIRFVGYTNGTYYENVEGKYTELPESIISDATVVFFDSVNSMGLTVENIKTLNKKYPNRLFYLIVQVTKDGTFKGGNDWIHLSDVAGEVSNRRLILYKNRYDEDNHLKLDARTLEDKIAEMEKKNKIRNAVKERSKPAEPKQTPVQLTI